MEISFIWDNKLVYSKSITKKEIAVDVAVCLLVVVAAMTLPKFIELPTTYYELFNSTEAYDVAGDLFNCIEAYDNTGASLSF